MCVAAYSTCVLQLIAHVCCSWSVLQCTAVCCNVLQCAALCCCSVLRVLQCDAVCCSVLQCVAVCCSVLQRIAACCSMLQRVAACCHNRYSMRSRKHTFLPQATMLDKSEREYLDSENLCLYKSSVFRVWRVVNLEKIVWVLSTCVCKR